MAEGGPSRHIDLEKIINEQAERLKELQKATGLIKGKQNIKNELQKAHDEVLQISCNIVKTKKMLKTICEQNARSREILTLVEDLDKRFLHQEVNVPPELIQGYQNATISSNPSLGCSSTVNSMHNQLIAQMSSSKISEKSEIVTDCKRTLFNEPEVCPTIPFFTLEEFNRLPKYIIGRPTTNNLETINNFIRAINQTLIAKYTILSMGKATAQKKGEINLYLHYKKQEFDFQEGNGYLYFFTTQDYCKQTKTKIDKTKLNLLSALRHCKHLRECRMKNEIRYVVIP